MRGSAPVRGTAIDRAGRAMLVAKSRWKRAAHQASSTQSRRRRPIITGRCPQAAPDAPRATRAAAARSSTHRCTSPHLALQRRDSCRRRPTATLDSANSAAADAVAAPLTAPPPPATKQTQRNRHRRNHAGSRLSNVEKLGKGAFSQVYKVERRGDRGVHYACKRIDISKMQKAELADAVNEIRILSSIKHPYIVGFYDAFLARRDRELWIVMEMCGCGDLASKVEALPQKTQVHGRARRLVPLHPDVRGAAMFARAEDRA